MQPERTKIRELLQSTDFGGRVTIKGWVRTRRGNKQVQFISVNDGSSVHGIQVVAEAGSFDEELLKLMTTGACVRATGELVESMGRGQRVEIQAQELELYGAADAESYPLQKKKHSLEFLREIAHLRPRTNTFGAVLRMRHHMSYAIHSYFHNRGFLYLHTPIITGSDCEGAGEMFRVTTLDPGEPPRKPDGAVDYSQDFFGRETSLTVSGQLEGELAALALSEVYTFGPTFRAENSNTSRHLAEFWMVEPEAAFYDIRDNMNLAEDFIKYLVAYALEHCCEEIEFLGKMYDQELTARLQSVAGADFVRMTYTEATEVLKSSGKSFDFPVEWGQDLQSEHERALVEHYAGRPVILTDYPREIKPFYMKRNDDGRTVRAMDVLFPQIGEIIGGSQREDDHDRLCEQVRLAKVPEKDVWWYLETRRFGSAPHSGFGLGFERLMVFVTGLGNIRDVIPFPRTPGSAEF